LARAELPPGAYEELLKEASEVLDIRITKVMDTSATPTDEPQFICDATVLGVTRSNSGIKRGETIQFKSYYVNQTTRQRGWAGPKVPPRLSVGQTWRISLKPGQNGNPFELAAYGRSFQPLDSQNAANNSPDRLGVNAMPAGGGGLLIANVNRRSIADKLGLRSGDRVIEINGTPINSNAEVGPAIAQSQEQVAIKFSRNGETIELTLKR
jgi:membrane-associated protease RseP (regulator of RpoE activity)